MVGHILRCRQMNGGKSEGLKGGESERRKRGGTQPGRTKAERRQRSTVSLVPGKYRVSTAEGEEPAMMRAKAPA